MDHAAPVQLAQEFLLGVGEFAFGKHGVLIGKETFAPRRLDQPVQEPVDAQGFQAARLRERVGAGQFFHARQLLRDFVPLALLHVKRRFTGLIFEDKCRDAGH